MQGGEEGEEGSDGNEGTGRRRRRGKVKELDAGHGGVVAVEVENEAVDDTCDDVDFVVDLHRAINGVGGYVGA